MKIGTISALAAFLFVGSIGCDQSKEELDKTKASLTSMTAERDGLKTQLDAANAKATALQQQVTDLTAKLASAAAPPPAAAAEEKPAAKHAAAKKAPAKPAETKKVLETEKKANTGAGHF